MSEPTRTGPWTVKAVLEWTAGHFREKGIESPRLEAEVLLASVLGFERVRLYVEFDRPLSDGERGAYRELVAKRVAGTPTAYLLGRREFYGRPFAVDRRVLIPRPETELLVDRALEAVRSDGEATVLDLCSGSGCVGVTLCCERPSVRVVAVDLSKGAAEVAVANARALGALERYDQRVGDLFAPVTETAFPVITANPPYVAESAMASLQREIRENEPREALVAGPVGTEVALRIVAEAPARLTETGILVIEHGEDQGEALEAAARGTGAYAEVSGIRDLAGHPRILVCRRGPVDTPIPPR